MACLNIPATGNNENSALLWDLDVFDDVPSTTQILLCQSYDNFECHVVKCVEEISIDVQAT
jgi:hypothetical protein